MGNGYSTYAAGNGKDLLVKLKGREGTVRFVDVLEPQPPSDTWIAVTIDNKTEPNDKLKTEKKLTYYSLDNATSIYGVTGDIVTMQSDGSMLIITSDNELATVARDEDEVTLTLKDGDTYACDDFVELVEFGIVTVGVGVGTVVGSGMTSTGSTWIEEVGSTAFV